MSATRFTQPVTLANGAQVPLCAVAANLVQLSSYLSEPDSEWDVVYYLREVCLGRTIEPEQTRALIREKLLAPDGTVDPDLKAVVLAAVRGEGRLLRVESPFTDPLDRALAEYVNARDYIRSFAPEGEVDALLRDDPAGWALRLLRRPPGRTDSDDKPDSPPPGTPSGPSR